MSYNQVSITFTLEEARALLRGDLQGACRVSAVQKLDNAVARAMLTTLDGFTEGERVIYAGQFPSEDREGTLSRVFPNGDCSVRLDEGYSAWTTLGQLTHLTPELSAQRAADAMAKRAVAKQQRSESARRGHATRRRNAMAAGRES